MNKEIFKFYKEQIKDYEKLSFKDAKEILGSSLEKDEESKNQAIERTFKGTLHHVLNYVEKSNYDAIQAEGFDLEDIISTSFGLWFEKIKDYSILKAENLGRVLGESFSRNLADRLIPSSTDVVSAMGSINTQKFNQLISVYFDMRNNNINADYEEILKRLNLLFKDGTIEWIHASSDRYEVAKWFELLEKCYLSFSKNDTENVDLSENNIIKLSKFIQEMGLSEKLDNNCPSNFDIEDDIVSKSIKEDVNNVIFNTDILSDYQKDIIARHFGLLGYDRQGLETIAKARVTSRETIWNRESRALRDLRCSAKVKKLEGYVR